ncbi:autophagy-related protein 18 [Hyphopichia burtonii NRRL Y-1933]|uniref:Autophagy-related protein 18 n=1 Tax=Hyphopichia burtonii NRRL Y-1933 TaxID=984485 RepID=A0A1E4RRK3_9ASCO|nr:autophagy-related protein 18 [Hyphopichia burtonii NRRL Y-1933]ODV69846.1 autophagy-related protein 18 [Hyphopichia burtonii NRRL Y-1933]
MVNQSEDSVNFITFNQDATCVAVGLNSGYKIFNCIPSFRKCYQFKKNESIGLIEMLYCTSLIAVVGLGNEISSSPRKLKIINTKRQSTICDLIFPSTILQVKLTKSKMIVLLEDQIYIYDITTMNLLHTIETSPNTNGLCAISNTECNLQHNSYLAYPSPPKTITHDSLLVNGINTNGGSNSVQNNIQSVSNSPNRVGDVIIFNLDSLQPLSVIEAHKSSLAAITLSNDGTLLATASDKGTIVRVFSVESGVKLYQFRRGTYPTKIYSLNFSFDNKYVVATSSSETVHIFRLGEDESLENKHRKKRNMKKRKHRKDPEYETIAEENEDDLQSLHLKQSKKNDDDEDEDALIQDDGDDSDAEDDEVDDEDDVDDDLEIISNRSRKLSQGSSNSFTSISSNLSNDEPKSEPIVDQNRLSVARLIRRSSQTLGRKAAQKMGDFLPSRFSSILEPTRHFASLKINTIGKDVKSIAVMTNDLQKDLVPPSYLHSKRHEDPNGNNEAFKSSSSSTKFLSMSLIHINVVTSEGLFYTYGLDPERGGDCILLHQYSLLDEGN